MSWSADAGDITADTTNFTADGAELVPPSAVPYVALVTSAHNQKPNFMAMVALVASGFGDITACILSMPAAFDIDLAVGKQQDVIGQWVGQARIVTNVFLPGFFGFADDPSGAVLGFGEQSNPATGGVWYEQGETFISTTSLSDRDYYTILKARIVKNQSNGTLSAIENALNFIFGVPCRVIDNGTLNLTITVSAPITPTQRALLNGLDLLPRPAGVAIGSITYSPL